MILQNILFPSPRTCTEEPMYFRREGDALYSWVNDCIVLGDGGSVIFDTYFNGFFAEKWMKYTKAKKISVTIKLEGCVRVTLMRKEKHFDEILTSFINEQICKTEKGEVKEFTFTFDSESFAGMYCFNIFSLQPNSAVYSGYYSCDLDENVDCRKVKIAVDICTFKRERFVAKNIAMLNDKFLQNPDSYLYDKLEVFVTDNAMSLDKSQIVNDKIHLFPNKNVGGAGGFTRGLIEITKVKKQKNITHVLVMDDDIIIEPESIFRTTTFLSCVKDEYKDIFVGGAMLRLDKQYIQTESGASWNSGNLISLKSGLDLRTCDACLYNEFEEKVEFNAWWYCAFPIDVVSDDNLPLPIFIRGDDVEYGLRNMKNLALMNGICVWHEPFENKYSSVLYYYILRNRLIDNSIHDMAIDKKEFISIMQNQVKYEIMLCRYKNARLLLKGVNDFYKGVDWLLKEDGAKLHQAIMKEGYKLDYIENLEVDFSYPKYDQSLKQPENNSFKHRVIKKLTLNGNFLPANREVIVPTVEVRHVNTYRAKKILNYDYTSRKGFVTVQDKVEAKACLKELKKMVRLTNKSYNSAIKSFQENGRKLMNKDFWLKYLEIDG